MEDKEKIIKIIHRHWFDILEQYFLILIITFGIIGAFFAFPVFFPDLTGESYTLFLFLETLFALAIWILGFVIWVDYYFDIWIITNERVINIEQKGFFTRTMSELKISKIQDITTDVVGAIPTVLNFGDVHIQTAGEQERFFFRQVPDPYGLKSILVNLQGKREKEKTDELGEMIEQKMHNV